MEAAPGEGAELMGVGGWEGGCCPPVIPPGMPPGPPIGPSLCGFGVPERSSPEAAEVLETVDCCEASSTTGFPSGPIEGGLVLLTEVLLPEWSPDSSGVLVGVIGCGVDVGGGMLFWGLLGIPGIPGPLGYIWVAPYPLILC